MNDRSTPDLSGDALSDPPPFRVPTGAPEGTAPRGSLSASDEPDDMIDEAEAEAEEVRATDDLDYADSAPEVWPEDEWVEMETEESEDGRPIESPYTDETALHAALSSEAMRNSGAYDYPLDDPAESSDYDFEHFDTGSQLDLDTPDAAPVLLAKADGGSSPPTTPTGQELEEPDENAPRNDREMDLIEHLGELRSRIMWCVGAITLAMMGTWHFARPIMELIIRPVKAALLAAGQKDGQIIVISPTEGFMLQFNISLITAVILVAPFLIFQIWKFVEPAMTKRERRFTGMMVPFSSLLFFMGCGLAYAMSPLFFAFFAQFVPPGTLANWSFGESAVLLAKMLLVCGFCFQVPVFTIFLNKSGVVERNVLIQYWRHVVVVIFVIVAIITPTWDPISLMVCALPPCFLYALSIWLVKWI